MKKGDVFYKYFNSSWYKCHVIVILDEPLKRIVYKYYGKYKQWWHYDIEVLKWVQTYINDGITYKKIK